jgi:hypothetical protein
MTPLDLKTTGNNPNSSMTTAFNSRKTAGKVTSRGYKNNGKMMAATQVSSPSKISNE